MALTYLDAKMIEKPVILDTLYVTSLTALSTTVQNTLTNDLTAINATGDCIISVGGPGDALRITQTGTGNALVVEDSTNPDATPFVVKNDGKVGIGTTTPIALLDVNGQIKTETVSAANISTRNLILPSVGGSIVNNAAFFGNVTIYGTISALSGLAVTSTFTSQSSALSVVNTGPEVALYVDQSPNLSGVAVFVGSGIEVLKINNPGPNPFNLPAVVVTGELSAGTGTSTGWNLAYNRSTIFEIVSSRYDDVSTVVEVTSGNWNSAYNTSIEYLTLSSAYVTVSDLESVSAILLPTSIYQEASSNWQSTFETVNALSSTWEESADILPTVTDYLSSNNVLVSALSLSSVTFTDRYVVATTLTATNTVLEVIVNGMPKYISLYDITV